MFGRAIAAAEAAISAMATLNTKLQEEIVRLEKENLALRRERNQWKEVAVASQRQRETKASNE